MPTPTYDSIFSLTLTTSAATVTLGSGGTGTIPSTYTDLVLTIDGYLASSTGSCTIKFNGNSSAVYSFNRILTTGTAWANGQNSSSSSGIIFSDLSSSKFAVIVNIFDYANTDVNKTIMSHQHQDYMGQYVGRFASTGAINSMTLIGHQSWQPGTTFCLYGIKAGN